MTRKKDDSGQGVERPVSLSPLHLREALSGLLAIPDPDATKPKAKDAGKPKRKKAPPPPKE